MGESGNRVQQLPRRLKLLDKQLAGLRGYGRPMFVSELDGFLAGVLVCPEEITPGEWLPMILGLDEDEEDGEEAEPVLPDTRQLVPLVHSVMEHYNSVAQALHPRSGRYAPIFDLEPWHDDVLWQDWIAGFERAMSLRPDSWACLESADEDTRTAFTCLFILAEIGRCESELPQEQVDLLADEAEQLIPYCVLTLNRWAVAQYAADHPELAAPQPAKAGRNEPCPCGSGKKFKKCCGLN